VKDGPVVNGSYVCDFLANVHNDAAQVIYGVYLGHGAFEEGEASNIETFEEDLTYTLIGLACEAWKDGEEYRRFVLCAPSLELSKENVFPVSRS